MREVSRLRMSRRLVRCMAVVVTGAALWVCATAQSQAPKTAPEAGDAIAVRFAFGGNVAQVPLEFAADRLLVPVSVNESKPALFLVATGDPHSVLDPAPWIPADSGPDTRVNFTNTLLSMPGLDLGIPHIQAESLGDISSILGRHVRGILGADILGQFVVEIESDRSAIHFHDMKSFHYDGKGKTLPLILRDGVPSVHLKLSMPNQPTFEDDFEIQTEFTGGLEINKPFISAHHLRPGKVKGFGFPDGKGGKTEVGRATRVTMGPYVFTNALVEFPQAASGGASGPGGAIGNAILRKFRVFLDIPHQQMIVETNSFYPTDLEADMSGVAMRASGPDLKSFVVAGVAPHSPGSDAGLKDGDIIAGVDGQPAADLNLSELRDMFRQIGAEYKLTVLRGDHTVELKLKTRRLV